MATATNKLSDSLNNINLPLNIISSAVALPPNTVTSELIDARIAKPSGYVKSRSGVVQRYHASADNSELSQSLLASQAVQKACAQSHLSEHDIDLLISVSAVPEQAIPCTASLILKQLGWHHHIACFDINASCIGILPALMTASSFLAQGVYQRIVIVACDLASRGLDWSNEESSLIFGDGACAIILENEHGNQHTQINQFGLNKGLNNDLDNDLNKIKNNKDDHHSTGSILAFAMQSFSDYTDHCQIRAGGTARNKVTGFIDKDFYFSMDGKPLFKMVAEHLIPFIESVLKKAGVTKDDIDLWVPHQASHLGLKHMTMRLGIDEDKVMNIYADYGNQVSASMPTALHIARESGRLQSGQTVMLLGTGAGVLFGALVWQL